MIAAASIHTVLAVHPSNPARTPAEFLDAVRKASAPVQYGVGGTGSGPHLAGELFAQAAGVKLQHIPYKGGGPMMADLLGGRIGAGFTVLSTAVPQIRAGKLRVLAVMSERRVHAAPDIPAVTEVVPGYAMPDIWVGVLGPAGLPDPILRRMHAEVARAINVPDIREKLAGAGFDVTGDLSPEQFAASVARSVEVFRCVTAAAGIRPE